MSDNTRKAVVTLAQVQEAFASYREIRGLMGDSLTGHTFDRGARGKGFAQYDATDSLVRTFDTKEEALTFYGRYAEIAREVMAAFNINQAESATEAPETSEGTPGEGESDQAAESTTEAPSVPSQRRRRVSTAS